jgi:sodium/bile acid cotransporter 7
MRRFFIHRWFLLALIAVIVGGAYFSAPLTRSLARLPHSWENVLIAAVMFLMALPLDARAIGRALRWPTATFLGAATNFIVPPLVACAIAPLLAVVSRDLALGLLIAASVPATISSAAVWTRRAGGNDAVALLVSMVTNLSCFAVTPLLLAVTAGAQIDGTQFRPGGMMVRLALIVALPIVLAQALRLVPRVAFWSARRKTPLGVACQFGMLTMVFTGVVQCGEKLRATGTDGIGWLGWAATIAAVLVVHLAALGAAQGLGRLLRMPREDWIALGFAGSQKTLLVGLGIAIGYANVFGPLAVLPMVAYHITQLLVDTLIADRLRAPTAEGGAMASSLGELTA